MAKDPAFLFYPGDWQGGTSTFSRHLKGCYMDVLIAQFNNGRLSLEEIKTVLGSDFGPSWPTLVKKFTKDPDGLFFNERLEHEKNKRAEYSVSRKNNRKSSYDKSYENHMSEHMENENRNENRNKDLKGGSGENVKRDIMESSIWIEDIAIKKRLSRESVTGYLENFLTDQILKENIGRPLKEIKKHFIDWLNIQLRNKPQGSKIAKAMNDIETGKDQRAEFFGK